MEVSKKRFIYIAIWVVICLVVGYLSSLATTSEVKSEWFLTLNKPFFNPPNWLFAPVWTTLYILMGIATGLVASSNHPAKQFAVTLFGFHLLVNGFWSIAFFGMHQPLLALVVILLMIGLIITLIAKYLPIHRTAAYVLVPYLLWVSFATVLNGSIVWLNS